MMHIYVKMQYKATNLEKDTFPGTKSQQIKSQQLPE